MTAASVDFVLLSLPLCPYLQLIQNSPTPENFADVSVYNQLTFVCLSCCAFSSQLSIPVAVSLFLIFCLTSDFSTLTTI